MKTPAIPWAEKHSRFTLMFEAFAIEVLRLASRIEGGRQRRRGNGDSAQQSLSRAVERGLGKRDLARLRRVGMDEQSFRRSQSHVTALNELAERRGMDGVEGRPTENASALINNIPPATREAIEAIA